MVALSNETLLILTALLNIIFIFSVARLKVEWLFASVIVNLILVSVFGIKLVTLFGVTTNIGNIFYACVFLATYFILEKNGKSDGLKTIWFGSICMLLFITMSQLVVLFAGVSTSDVVSSAIINLFSFSTRITCASLLAFIFAQYVNISIYEWIKLRRHGKSLWIRSNVSNIIAQLFDSLLFFSIAFPDLSWPVLIQAIFGGWIIKILIVSLGTPFLYLHAYLERKKI